MSNVVDFAAVRALRTVAQPAPADGEVLDADEVIRAATEALITLTAENARLRALLDDRRTVRRFGFSGMGIAFGGILASLLS